MENTNIKAKFERISELLESKNCSVMDDYFIDIFLDDETDEEIFRSAKCDESTSQKEQHKTVDRIIEKLENYKPKSKV